MSEEAPLNARTVEAFAPVVAIACADAMGEYLDKKQTRGSPASMEDAAAKFQECVTTAYSKVEASPCSKLLDEYDSCLSSKRYARVYCMPVKARLEECAAKHVGKLD